MCHKIALILLMILQSGTCLGSAVPQNGRSQENNAVYDSVGQESLHERDAPLADLSIALAQEPVDIGRDSPGKDIKSTTKPLIHERGFWDRRRPKSRPRPEIIVPPFDEECRSSNPKYTHHLVDHDKQCLGDEKYEMYCGFDEHPWEELVQDFKCPKDYFCTEVNEQGHEFDSGTSESYQHKDILCKLQKLKQRVGLTSQQDAGWVSHLVEAPVQTHRFMAHLSLLGDVSDTSFFMKYFWGDQYVSYTDQTAGEKLFISDLKGSVNGYYLEYGYPQGQRYKFQAQVGFFAKHARNLTVQYVCGFV